MSRRSPLSLARLRGRAVVRDADEEHRSATPLELLFDLVFVVAVGRAAAALHHELVADHVADGVIGFAALFFAVWWAWMNFTWFASAHDCDDVPYRLLTLVQMAGVLVLASGVTRAVEEQDYVAVTLGYAIMRFGLVAGWLRVARDQPSVRDRALRYAGLISVLQVLWLGRLGLPEELAVTSFVLLGIGEVTLPMWAERATGQPVFHPGHIEERYGLFTIIVLGESIISATAGFQIAVDEVGLTADLLAVGLAALVVAFAAWWLYFDHPGHLAPGPTQAFRWGYGHVVLFAALAALGAGVHVAAETVVDDGATRTASLALAIPAAGYLLGLALVMTLTGIAPSSLRVYPKLAGAAVMVAIGLVAPVALTAVGCALVMVFLTVWMVLVGPPDDVGAGEAIAPLEGIRPVDA